MEPGDLQATLAREPAIGKHVRRSGDAPLRIALVAPLFESVPPRTYGGTERVVAYLADALVDLGHEVTLHASGDSRTRARLKPHRAQALRLDPAPHKSDLASHLAMLHDVRRTAAEVDIVHFHTDILHFPLFEAIAPYTLTTLHGRLDLPDLDDVFYRWPAYPLASISDDQRRPLPDANWMATVHHGLPLELSPSPARGSGDYLAFVGRISPEKRPDRAIRIARAAGKRLRIAAKVDAADTRYFHDEIEPLLDASHVEFVGELDEAAKRELMMGASALLFPIDWPEPFGLVMIEAMACGTPVVAWRRGSVPEVIEEGINGFVVESDDEAVAACARAAQLDRSRVRQSFERRFTSRTMAMNYVELYETLVEARSRAGAVLPAAASA